MNDLKTKIRSALVRVLKVFFRLKKRLLPPAEAEKGKGKYTIETHNLAVPEVHVDGAGKKAPEKKARRESVSYRNLAVPEVHVKRKEQ